MKAAGKRVTTETDPTEPLVDLLAEVADTLSKFQQRIAEESHLATGEHRRSVRELSRKIKALAKETSCLRTKLKRDSRSSKKSKANSK